MERRLKGPSGKHSVLSAQTESPKRNCSKTGLFVKSDNVRATENLNKAESWSPQGIIGLQLGEYKR